MRRRGVTRPDISARLIGRELQPLAIIDDFAPDPDVLRSFAEASRFGPARHLYPGLRAPVAPDYWRTVQGTIATVLHDVFDCRDRVRLLDMSYSIVTTRPEDLSTEQRLPHVDSTSPGRIALTHYLASEGGDGTAFFRHRATGFETVSETREQAYYASLNAELRKFGSPPAAYICDTTPLFERIALGEGRYNRALIYRSSLLHSGAIRSSAKLSPDPAIGRLTVTAFLEAS